MRRLKRRQENNRVLQVVTFHQDGSRSLVGWPLHPKDAQDMVDALTERLGPPPIAWLLPAEAGKGLDQALTDGIVSVEGFDPGNMG